MQIRFKNKYTMAIISMIEKGKALGGLPSVIELSVEEAIRLVYEINTLNAESDAQLHRYKFTTGDKVDARLSFRNKPLSEQEIMELVTKWTEGSMTVSFDGVPLHVIIIADSDKNYHN